MDDPWNGIDTAALVAAARTAREVAYAPYSGFKVGAALLTGDGRIFTGCNVENASFGASNCAERTALFKAVSEGCRELAALAVVADTEGTCPPCGVCRQALVEFAPELPMVLANLRGTVEHTTLAKLLPRAFGGQALRARDGDAHG